MGSSLAGAPKTPGVGNMPFSVTISKARKLLRKMNSKFCALYRTVSNTDDNGK